MLRGKAPVWPTAARSDGMQSPKGSIVDRCVPQIIFCPTDLRPATKATMGVIASFSGFDNYMNKLTPFNNHRNPWFRDYWQESFGCRVPYIDDGRRRRQFLSGPGGGLSPLGGGVTEAAAAAGRHAFTKNCDMGKRLKDHFEQDSKVQFVIDAVYAFAIALDKLRGDVCLDAASQSGMCPQMADYDGGQFYQNYLLKVDFTGQSVSQSDQ